MREILCAFADQAQHGGHAVFVLAKSAPRSYDVGDNGTVYCRNRRHIRLTKEANSTNTPEDVDAETVDCGDEGATLADVCIS